MNQRDENDNFIQTSEDLKAFHISDDKNEFHMNFMSTFVIEQPRFKTKICECPINTE